MNKKFKKAFTIIETLVILVIIGFILIAELMILNNKTNDYGQAYYTTYNFLKKSTYNILADMYCPGDACPDKKATSPRPFPDEPEVLCSRYAEYLNVTKNNCNNLTTINDRATGDFKTKTPHLVASNSYRIYFGKKYKYEIGDKSFDYFVIYVDLNGEKSPNRVTCEGRSKPDIVPFAVTKRGETIPMGFPVYSNSYITAKIIYPSTYDSGNIVERKSGSLSLYEAIYGAWPANDPDSNEVAKNIDFPFTLMFADEAHFKNSNIRQCYNNNRPNGLLSENQFKQNAASKEAEGCKAGTYNCRVVIDSSTVTRF